MMKRAKFGVTVTYRKGKKYWRIRIPASMSPTGKPKDIIYTTRAAADADRLELMKRQRKGELTATNFLTVAQIDDVRTAYKLIAEEKIDLTLEDAVRMAIEHRRARMHGVTVSVLFERYEAEVSEARQWSTKYRSTWRGYSTKFAAEFGERNVADVDTESLRVFFSANFGSSASYYNSAIAVVAPAFTWAAKRDIIQKSPFDALEKRKNAPSDGVDVYTPEEALRLLTACRSYKRAGKSHPMADAKGNVRQDLLQDCTDALVPFAVLLFAGVRPEELTKLTWDNVIDEKMRGHMSIHISADVAKTRQVRIVRVRPTLQAFLDLVPQEERKGKIIPQSWVRKASIVRKAAGLQNRADAARHSFASYALASGESVDAVREDMGHARGSDMLFKHYRAAVTYDNSCAYWAISPAKVAAARKK